MKPLLLVITLAVYVSSRCYGLVLPPHRIIKANKAFDIKKDILLVKSQENRLLSVDYEGNILKQHTPLHGVLQEAKLTPCGHVVRYVVDQEFHTIYFNDHVIISTTCPILSFGVYDHYVLVILKNHEIALFNLQTFSGRFIDFARLCMDFPCCATMCNNCVFVGTLTGEIVTLNDKLEHVCKVPQEVPVASTAICALPTEGDGVEITLAYIDKTLKKVNIGPVHNSGRARSWSTLPNRIRGQSRSRSQRVKVLSEKVYPVDFPYGDHTFIIDSKGSSYFRTFSFLCNTTIIKSRLSNKTAVLKPSLFKCDQKAPPLLEGKTLVVQVTDGEVLLVHLKL
jgi:hypothetical protein